MKTILFGVEICRFVHYVVPAITLFLCSECCRNYLRADTIQGQKLFAEIFMSMNLTTMCMIQVDRRGPTGGHLVNCKLQIDIWNLTSHDLHGHVMAMCEIRPM